MAPLSRLSIRSFLLFASFGTGILLGLTIPRDVGKVENVEPVPSREPHPFDKFIAGFPKLRGPEARGSVEADSVVSSGRTVFDWPRMNKIFAFGDSYSTLEANGVDSGNPQHLHDRATDMKWTDYLYAVFRDYHMMQYYNFARNGAVIDPAVVPPGLLSYGSFIDQVDEFEDLFIPRPWNVQWSSQDSLFIVMFGGNDLSRMFRDDAGRQDIQSITHDLADALISSCRRLHSLGARSFLILNQPPFNQSPKYAHEGAIGHELQHLVATAIPLFNARIAEQVGKWRQDTEDVNVMLFDLHSLWSLVLKYPEVYGMTECSRYIMSIDGIQAQLGRMGFCFHDNLHISWSGAEIVARTIHGFLLRHSPTMTASEATESSYTA